MPKSKRSRAQSPPTVAKDSPLWWRDRVLWLLTAVAALLLLWNLGGRCLWQDEAETALLGRNILHYGKPVASDGTNIISQEAGREFEADQTWRWSPWAQFYLAAGGLKIFGDSTLGVRLPFALLATLVVPLTYLLALRACESVLIARLASLILTSSVWFLLHARQARWHAPAYVLACLILLAVLECRRSIAWTVILALSAAALFYTNYFVAICFLFAVAIASVFLGWSWRLMAALAGAALLSLPGVFYFHVLEKPGAGHFSALKQFSIYLIEFFTFVTPLIFVAIATMDKRPVTRFLLALVIATCAALAFAPWTMFRYLTILFPAAALLTAIALEWLLQKNAIVGWIATALLIFTPLLHRFPFGYMSMTAARQFDHPISPLLAFFDELSAPPHESECVAADYLKAHAAPDDTVLTTYGDLVLQFYTGLHVVGGMEGQNLPTEPEWIIVRSFVLSADPGKDLAVHRFIQTQIDTTRYEVVAASPDSPLIGNPDPTFHAFRDVPDAKPMRILHRVR